MSKRYPLAQFVLPAIVDPPRICTTVQVPDDPQHIAAFLGALYNLTMSASWQRDPDHTAALVSRVWTDVFDNIVMGNCAVAGSEDMQFRQNGCKLEYSIDCVNWLTLYDPTDCIHEIAGQIGGQGTTSPGECKTVSGALPGNGRYLIPYPVSTGDTVTLTASDGAWQDGNVGPWNCPNGQSYVLGICAGAPGTDGGDPLPTAFHMSIILKLNTPTIQYFDLTAGPVTIPASVNNVDVELIANDSDLTDNAGEVTFTIEVCNNTAPGDTFEHVFDFTIDDQGFTPYSSRASYSAGVGWGVNTGSGFSGLMQIQGPTFASRVLTSFEYFMDLAMTGPYHTVQNIIPNVAGVETDVSSNSLTDITVVLPGSGISGTSFWSGLANDNASPGGLYSGHLTKVIMRGNGTDPV